MKLAILSSIILALGASAAPQVPTRSSPTDPEVPGPELSVPEVPSLEGPPSPVGIAPPAPGPLGPLTTVVLPIDPNEVAAAAPTLTLTSLAINPAGCGGIADRSIVEIPETKHQYQQFCNAQPAGYAAIPGALMAAVTPESCMVLCEYHNAELPRQQYACRAALYTLGDKNCQLLWQADGNVVSRQDSHYIVAHNF